MINKISEIGFIFDVSFLIISFFLIFKFRNQISNFILLIPISPVILGVLSSIPFILIEESINCINYGDGLGCRMTTWINFVLIFEILILLYFTKKNKITSIKKPIIIFSFIGLFWELFFGGLRGFIFTPFILFMAPYVMLSYAYISLIPLTLITNKIKKEKNL